METLVYYFEQIFGKGNELTSGQMCLRGLVIFVIALLLLRLSGRRSFGLHTPLDNIVSILLGAVLSRAVTGASPFFPVVCTCLVVTLLHRLFLWLTLKNKRFKQFCEGDKILLFDDGNFIDHNMTRALTTKEDIMQSLRLEAMTDDLDKVEKIYMERNGEISIVKKSL